MAGLFARRRHRRAPALPFVAPPATALLLRPSMLRVGFPAARLFGIMNEPSAGRDRRHKMNGPSGLRLATCFGLAVVLPAAQTPPTAHPRDEWRVIAKECRDVLPAQAKIRACLNLLSDQRLAPAYLAPINAEISSTFQGLRDYGNAIKYKNIEIAHANTAVEQPSASSEALPASFGAMSLRYLELGTLQSLNRLAFFDSQSDEARRDATEEQSNYNQALSYNPMNYRAIGTGLKFAACSAIARLLPRTWKPRSGLLNRLVIRTPLGTTSMSRSALAFRPGAGTSLRNPSVATRQNSAAPDHPDRTERYQKTCEIEVDHLEALRKMRQNVAAIRFRR